MPKNRAAALLAWLHKYAAAMAREGRYAVERQLKDVAAELTRWEQENIRLERLVDTLEEQVSVLKGDLKIASQRWEDV